MEGVAALVCDVAGTVWAWLTGTAAGNAPVIVPILAVLIPGLVAWLTARHVSRQKATIDLIEKRESTDFYVERNRAFSARRRSGNFADLHDPQDDAGRDERQKILDYLNHYELVALGIQTKLLNGRFYRKWMGSAFVRDWNAAADFIQRERWKRDEEGPWLYEPKVWAQFETIACRWSRDAVRLKGRPRIPPSEASEPSLSDAALPDLAGEANAEPARDGAGT